MGQKSEYNVVQCDSLLGDSHGWNPSVSRAVSLSGDAGKEPGSRLIQVIDRIQVLIVARPKSPSPCCQPGVTVSVWAACILWLTVSFRASNKGLTEQPVSLGTTSLENCLPHSHILDYRLVFVLNPLKTSLTSWMYWEKGLGEDSTRPLSVTSTEQWGCRLQWS